MKLWEKDIPLDKLIEGFTIGQDNVLDLELAPYDVQGSKAHAKMLCKVGLLTEDDLLSLITELDIISGEIEKGNFKIETGVEDVHSQVELMLTRKLGDVGKKIHAGRSRNDQVLLDLRLYFRDRLNFLEEDTRTLANLFIELSGTHKDVLMPGYTHMQVGMVSSFGLWFGSFGEALADDILLLETVAKINNQNPLGSAAGYGNSFPLDRKMTTELLDFNDLCYNSIYAQFGRGKTELLISQALASLAYTISKFAMDVTLYSNQNYNFLKLPNELTTGSSIMPHKKNPDVFELIRAKCNQLQGLPGQISMLCSSLPTGYHRDFQQLKELIFPAIKMMDDILKIMIYSLPKIEVKNNLLDSNKYDYLYSVEVVNKLVQEGTPFRDAYKQVAEDIENGNFKPDKNIMHTHEGSIGNLSSVEILNKINR